MASSACSAWTLGIPGENGILVVTFDPNNEVLINGKYLNFATNAKGQTTVYLTETAVTETADKEESMLYMQGECPEDCDPTKYYQEAYDVKPKEPEPKKRSWWKKFKMLFF
jgi:hypothetical protein